MLSNSEINNVYRRKFKTLQKRIKDILTENAALCDQVAMIQENINTAKEERRFLVRRLLEYTQEYDLIENLDKKNIPKKKGNPEGNGKPKPEPVKPNRPNNDSHKQIKQKSQPDPQISIKTEVNDQQVFQSEFAVEEEQEQPQIEVEIPYETQPNENQYAIGNLVIQSLGEIDPRRPGFHNEHWIYPLGYSAVRIFGSMKDPFKKSLYTCRITDGGVDQPRFEMTSEMDPEIMIVGPSPDFCHSTLLQYMKDTFELTNFNLQSNGDWFFGLAHPVVKSLIESLPNISACQNFKFFIKTEDETAVYEKENDPAINFEAFQHYISTVCNRFSSVPEVKKEEDNSVFHYFQQ